MSNNRTLLRDSWKKCEELLVTIANNKLNKTKLSKDQIVMLEFLSSIRLVIDNEASLTEKGREYYKLKYIQEEPDKALEILTEQVKQHPATQAICQLLWGKKNIKRSNVYRLLVFQALVDPKNFQEKDLGGFLMSLNQCNIIKYSKQTQAITILYNPKGEAISPPKEIFISPETAYSNVKNLREILRIFTDGIYWIDKHFSAKGLEPLADEADGNKISEIKILTGPSNVNERMKKDFERFKQEIENRGISVEMKVICDKDVLNSIHGRWIMSEDLCYNLPPVNSIFQGQYDEMKRTENRPPFEQWWKGALPLLENYEQIIKISTKQ